jgi:hypothetical protein
LAVVSAKTLGFISLALALACGCSEEPDEPNEPKVPLSSGWEGSYCDGDGGLRWVVTSPDAHPSFTLCDPKTSGVSCVRSGPCPVIAEEDAGMDEDAG